METNYRGHQSQAILLTVCIVTVLQKIVITSHYHVHLERHQIFKKLYTGTCKC